MSSLNFKELDVYASKMLDFKVKCECGHSVIVIPKHINKKGYSICSHCGKKIYCEKKDEFKDKLLKELRR